SSATPRLVARCARCTAGQHSTCASIFGSDAGDSQRAPSTVTQSLPFILTSAALRKTAPNGGCGSDETARCKQSHAAYQRGPGGGQAASDPIAEGMTNE